MYFTGINGSYNVRFYILDNVPAMGILGNEFPHGNKCVLNYKNDTITIGDLIVEYVDGNIENDCLDT